MIITFLFIINSFLSKNEPIKANILVVEGWLPFYNIQLVNKEFKNNHYDYLITTGLKLDESDFYEVAYNGYLIFYPQKLCDSGNYGNKHVFEIYAHSKKGGKYCSHFNFFVNDSLVTDFKVEKKQYKYKVEWQGSLSKVDSIMIQFDNDLADYFGDRNLYIKEIIIDSKTHISYQFNSEYDIGLLDGKERIINNYDSFAELARKRLIASGLDSSDIIAIPGRRSKIKRTITSALAFKEWLDNSGTTVKGINIVSQGVHSRRTWMTYHKILGKSYDIGIIALPEHNNGKYEIPDIFKISYEIIGIIYYWVILTFMHK